MNAAQLSKLKELAGVSQADAARRMRVSRQYVGQMARKHGIVFVRGARPALRLARPKPSVSRATRVGRSSTTRSPGRASHDR